MEFAVIVRLVSLVNGIISLLKNFLQLVNFSRSKIGIENKIERPYEVIQWQRASLNCLKHMEYRGIT